MVLRSQRILLRRIHPSERSMLEGLMDAYLAELAATTGTETGDAASYEYLPLYWREPERHPFFVFIGGICVGFALIRELREESAMQMSEFYVRPECRRRGLGRAAVDEIWRRFPGAWRLEVHCRNQHAVVFWSQCIREFASGNIEVSETLEDDGGHIHYSFDIAVRDGPAP